MTQPDEYMPPGAANYDSFAGFATTSQTDYENQLNDQVGSAYGNISGICDLLAMLPFFGGLGDLGDTSTNGVTGGMLGGVQALADALCGFATGSESTGTTPQTVMSGVSAGNDAVNNNSFVSGLIDMGGGSQEGTGQFGGLLNGLTALLGALCGSATGSTDVSATTPQTVIDGANGFVSAGADLLGSDATNATDLLDFGGGFLDDALGFLGDPLGLGSGSVSGSIPVDNVAGLLGPPTIGGTAQAMVDGVYQGLTNTTDVGVSLATMTNSMSALARDVEYLKGGSAAAGANPPIVTHYGIAGSHTYDIPTWSDYLDVVVLGGGGGGYGMPLISLWGEGGDGGNWNQVTLERGVDIPGTTTTLSITVGGGGDGGSSGAGDTGGTSSASGTGWAGITATGGAGGSSGNLDTAGKSPGNDTFDGVIYYGGLESNPGFGQADGNAPGGGGSGGKITFMQGGSGAPGAVWVLAYETPGS